MNCFLNADFPKGRKNEESMEILLYNTLYKIRRAAEIAKI